MTTFAEIIGIEELNKLYIKAGIKQAHERKLKMPQLQETNQGSLHGISRNIKSQMQEVSQNRTKSKKLPLDRSV